MSDDVRPTQVGLKGRVVRQGDVSEMSSTEQPVMSCYAYWLEEYYIKCHKQDGCLAMRVFELVQNRHIVILGRRFGV